MTALVELRAFDARDEPRLALLFDEPEVRQWNPGPTPDAVHAWWWDANRAAERHEHRTWAVADSDDDRLLGTVSVFGLDPGTREAEIGYRVLSAEQGRGVAKAAVAAAVVRAARELKPSAIRLLHAVENVASCRVALACGFAPVGVEPGTEPYGDGLIRDEHMHRLVLGSRRG